MARLKDRSQHLCCIIRLGTIAGKAYRLKSIANSNNLPGAVVVIA